MEQEKAKRYDKAIEKAEKWHNAPNVDKIPTFGNRIIEDIFPELKESEDERIRKSLIELFHDTVSNDEIFSDYGLDKIEVLAWLEKQGEQNHVDKVEPKFHVGDFIKHNVCNIICKVITVNSESYYIENIKTGCRIECFSAEQNFHLWTIEDAKEGDVLAGKIDGDSYILIYKQIKDGWIETYGHYYDSVDRFCVPSQLFCREVKGTFRPTTKEQKEFLFQKMRKAGYEWDADKKELKKL